MILDERNNKDVKNGWLDRMYDVSMTSRTVTWKSRYEKVVMFLRRNLQGL